MLFGLGEESVKKRLDWATLMMMGQVQGSDWATWYQSNLATLL